MQKIDLSMNWLNKELESLCDDNSVFEKALSFKSSLKDVLSSHLQCELWELSEFFVLAIAFNLMEELCSNNKTVGSMYRHEWASGVGIIRQLMTTDVREICDKFARYYYEKLELLKKLCLSKGINALASPIVWLELAESLKSDLYVQRYVTTYEMTNDNPPVGIEVKKTGGMIELVVPELAKLIRYRAFSLSEQEEDANDEFPYVYTLAELAKRWETNEQNVIAVCGKSNYFWPYLNLSEGMHLYERSLPITTTMINANLRNGNLQADYKYGFKGYVRLTKKSELPHKITLEYFHANKSIDPKTISAGKKYSSCIWVEPPFCKYILGVYQFIEVTCPIEPTLFFLADEIHTFEELDQFKKIFIADKNTSTSRVIDAPPLNDEKNIDLFIEPDSLPLNDNEIKHRERSETSHDNLEINKFSKNGNCYEIAYADQKFILKASKGLEYIEHLLKNALKEIHVRGLERIIHKSALPDEEICLAEAKETDLNVTNNAVPDNIADKKAIKTVSAELKVKEEELEIAKQESKIELAEKIEEEIEQLKQYLNGALGKNYKLRKMPDENEKARKRVLDAINNARNTIKSYNQLLFEHLFQSIKTGYFCVYKPDPSVDWL